MSKYIKNINLIILFAFSFISVLWTLSSQNSFCFDDTFLLWRANSSSYEELFSFFPHSVYMDRPFGNMFLKFLQDLFGLDYGRHHVILVLIHLFNVLMTFCITKDIFWRKYRDDDKGFLGGIISAAFFGIWARTHMAVQWDTAIFDLLGTFFSLLSMLFYLRYRNKEKYKGQNLCLLLIFFYCAIRTKEMFLVLPLLYMLYEIWEMTLEKKLKQLTKAVKLGLGMFVVFVGILVFCKMQGSVINSADHSYYQSFDPIKLIYNLLRYCIVCFNLEDGGWGFAVTFSGVAGLVIVLIGLAIAIWKAIVSQKVDLFLCYVAIAISIAMVLPMINQVHALYLYFPTIFVGILIAAVINGLNIHRGSSLILMCLFLATSWAPGTISTREYWLSVAEMEKYAWEDISEIQAPVPETTIYIRNLGNVSYTPFYYGEGAICNLIYNDPTLKVVLMSAEEEIEYMVPYVVWNYQNERIVEVERNNNRELLINNLFSYPQEDGSLVLSIVPDKISPEMLIYVDGVSMQPAIGEDFISVQIAKNLLEGKESIVINIEDQYMTVSEDYILSLVE